MAFTKKMTIASVLFIGTLAMTACGMNAKEALSKLGSSDVSYEDKESEKKETSKAQEKTIARELYLLDKNGYIVPQTVELPQTNSAAKQVLEYLVEDGPISEILPNGFQGVIPAGVEMTVDIKDNTAIVDFSNEIKDYKASSEQKILQSITWTLTQFDNIKQVKINMNGYEQTEMPIGNTPIGDGLTREDGINFDSGEVVDITNTKSVTLYFLSQNEDGGVYYVPITRRVDDNSGDMIETVVNELVKGPSVTSPLVSDFDPDATLLDVEKSAGKVVLNFNEYILGSSGENVISGNVLQSLVLSLTEQKDVDSISVKVNGNADILNDKGEKISEAVTRPDMVNEGKY